MVMEALCVLCAKTGVFRAQAHSAIKIEAEQLDDLSSGLRR
eukprot:CAMPEP_0194548662 /NCGR_PEP_ID=MMETSP0253-20130528/93968_1 /TAXON_ID=2966 /ORGANISM="Noctiluca scintillans" /LENGTH=40 /DNA_ID= /DNA_START= /DNA_END= /DNA_ORIENTATION=